MKKQIYNERFDIRIPADLLKESEKVARSKYLTLSQMIRNLLVREVQISKIK